MTKEEFLRAKELLEIIETTKKGLDALESMEIRVVKENRFYDDGLHTLVVSNYRDGSGKSTGIFNRYYGNKELYDVIIKTLYQQLEKWQTEFESI